LTGPWRRPDVAPLKQRVVFPAFSDTAPQLVGQRFRLATTCAAADDVIADVLYQRRQNSSDDRHPGRLKVWLKTVARGFVVTSRVRWWLVTVMNSSWCMVWVPPDECVDLAVWLLSAVDDCG
jgi:hypothetical protein